MPYVVKTRRRIRPLMPQPRDADVLSDVAVATLDEAIEWVDDQIILALGNEAEGHRLRGLIPYPDPQPVTEQGGRVSLPDGTEIEVEQVDMGTLVLALRDPIDSDDPTDEQIIDVYNASRSLPEGVAGRPSDLVSLSSVVEALREQYGDELPYSDYTDFIEREFGDKP